VLKLAIEEKMKNARMLYELAIKELKESKKEPDKIRDASEKAWGATASAIEALIEKKTGKEIIKGKERSKKLMTLIETDKVIPAHIGFRYFTREDFLHGDCFYLGKCEPKSEIKRRIRETKDLLDDIEKMIKEKPEKE